MSKQKFKVGDRVRIVEAYPNIHNNELAEVVGPSYGVFGELVCVKLQSGDLWTCIKVEPVKTKHLVIVITADGKTTTATEREGKKVIKTASATCSEKDTFDFSEGARVAFERLQGRDPFQKEDRKPDRPKKLVCVRGGCCGYLKAGKVYDVEWRSSGKVFDIVSEVHQFSGDYVDGKYTAPSSYGTAMFIPFVED